MAGGSAQLGEARVDIVADDASLSRGLARAEGKVRASAARMSRSARPGIAAFQRGGEAEGLWNARSGLAQIAALVRSPALIVTIATIAAKYTVGTALSGIELYLGKNLKDSEDLATKAAAAGEERAKILEAGLIALNAKAAGELGGTNVFDEFIQYLKRQGLPVDSNSSGAVNDAWDAIKEFFGGESTATKKAAAERELKDELVKQQRKNEILKANANSQKFNNAVDTLQHAADSLTKAFDLSNIPATLDAISADIKQFSSMQGRLYYASATGVGLTPVPGIP